MRIAVTAEAARVAARVYQIDAEEVFAKCRSRSVVLARDLTLWLVKESTRWSYSDIGHAFDMHHSSVIVAIRRETERLEREPQLLGAIEEARAA